MNWVAYKLQKIISHSSGDWTPKIRVAARVNDSPLSWAANSGTMTH